MIPLSKDMQDTITEAASVDLRIPDVSARREADPKVPLLICVLKDELQLLDEFYAHYRALGIERFLMVDNGSTDGTTEYLAAQADTNLYRIDRPFRWQVKQGWINRLIAEHGLDRWYVYVDADEHLIFDGSESHSITELAARAEASGIRRVRGMLVDLYGDGPLLDFAWDGPAGQRLIDAFPNFDTDSYVDEERFFIMSRKGGPRKRAMAAAETGLNPELSKYPLFRPAPGDLMSNPHHLYPYQEFQTDCLIGLLHFKFLPGFIHKVKKAVAEKTYWDDSFEYRTYLRALEADPRLEFAYPGSRRFDSSRDLLDAGLIEPIDWDAPTPKGDPL